jgi:hypothetical protein
VLVAVAVVDNVAVAVGVSVLVAVAVFVVVAVAVDVNVAVAELENVIVAVDVVVIVAVFVEVDVAEAVEVDVPVAVEDNVAVAVEDDVAVDVEVDVGVAVDVITRAQLGKVPVVQHPRTRSVPAFVTLFTVALKSPAAKKLVYSLIANACGRAPKFESHVIPATLTLDAAAFTDCVHVGVVVQLKI